MTTPNAPQDDLVALLLGKVESWDGLAGFDEEVALMREAAAALTAQQERIAELERLVDCPRGAIDDHNMEARSDADEVTGLVVRLLKFKLGYTWIELADLCDEAATHITELDIQIQEREKNITALAAENELLRNELGRLATKPEKNE